MKKVRQPQLYLLAKEEILNHILKNRLEPGTLLPPENQLATQLGISRGTLREAMRVLEEEAVVRRRQGVGTFISDSHDRIHSTLDMNEGVSEMIIGRGKRPGSRDTKIEEIKASRKLADQLNVKPGDPIISLTRIRTADDVPVAYTMDFLPLGIVPPTFSQDFRGGSLYTYMEELLGIELTQSMLRIQPIKAPKSMAHALDIRPGTLLMLLKQTDRDTNFVPVLYSEEYFVADRFEFIVFRRGKKRMR